MNQNQSNLTKRLVRIHGTHCASCEVLIERKFKEVPGVVKVKVNHANGKAKLLCSRVPELGELQECIKPHGYSATWWEDKSAAERAQAKVEQEDPDLQDKKKHYVEIGCIFFVVVAAWLVLRRFDLVPDSLAITTGMSYWVVLGIGLVAALSTCIAVTGGLLLAVAAKYNERHPGLTGAQRLRPHLYFNAGRVVSYTVLGGAVGSLGSVVTLSPYANGILTIVASLVMILLGLQLLKLFPRFSSLQPRMPKALAHRIEKLSTSDSKFAASLLGAGTFFLPCGFTQALQLYVLSQGGFARGALTMLVFSLGTLPALVSLGAISSFARGGFQRYFLKFAGVVVVMVGIFSVRNGLALTGWSANFAQAFRSVVSDSAEPDPSSEAVRAPIIGGKQIVEMKIVGLEYEPSRFTVVKDIPVEWRIDGSQASGCATVVQSPALGLTEYVSGAEVKVVTFTPDSTGEKPFSCSMGMTTRGAAFTVIEDPDALAVVEDSKKAVVPQNAPRPEVEPLDKDASVKVEGPAPAEVPADDPADEPQKITLVVGYEKGFWPPTLTVKQDRPVELTVDVQVPLGGCMSTLVIPQFDIAQLLQQGTNVFTFTPTEPGDIPVTCPMGVPMTTIEVEA